MHTFEIHYRIPDHEWRIVASGGPGLEGEPAFHYLNGEVTLLVDGASPWGAPFHVSVADLALAFHEALERGFPSRCSEALVSETDGGLDLALRLVGAEVEMRIPSSSVVARVEGAAWVLGVETFLRAFVREIRARAPGALEEGELQPLGTSW